jgi:hypothetical protein
MTAVVKSMLFLAQKGPFLAFDNPLETIKDFYWPQRAIYDKINFFGSRKLFRKAGFVKNRPFMRPTSAFLAQKRVF